MVSPSYKQLFICLNTQINNCVFKKNTHTMNKIWLLLTKSVKENVNEMINKNI